MTLMRRRELLQRSASALLTASLAPAGTSALAQSARNGIDLTKLTAQNQEDGLFLSYDVRFDLPHDIEQALSKGIAVVFVAEAEVFRTRWYWTDQSRNTTTRRWRLAYQPLTRQWRVSFDGLSRHYSKLTDALDALRRGTQWRIGEALPSNDDQDYYVDFSFKLDTNELPRPMQIGLGGQTDWNLSVQRRVGIPLPR
jgi:hypothetical protein